MGKKHIKDKGQHYRLLLVLYFGLFLYVSVSYAGQLVISDPFGYDGSYNDAESTTLYLKARNYSARDKRFISQDSYGYFNRYDSFNAEPISTVDPTGHNAKKLFHKIGKVFNYIQDSQSGLLGSYQVVRGLLTSSKQLFFAGSLIMVSGGLGLAADIVQHSQFARKYNQYRLVSNSLLLGLASSFIWVNTGEVKYYQSRGLSINPLMKLKYIFVRTMAFVGSTGVAYAVNKALKKWKHVRTVQMSAYLINTAMLIFNMRVEAYPATENRQSMEYEYVSSVSDDRGSYNQFHAENQEESRTSSDVETLGGIHQSGQASSEAQQMDIRVKPQVLQDERIEDEQVNHSLDQTTDSTDD